MTKHFITPTYPPPSRGRHYVVTLQLVQGIIKFNLRSLRREDKSPFEDSILSFLDRSFLLNIGPIKREGQTRT
ncbi:MAG TPA: hypothetical protein VMW89_15715 [Desulfatiglandales bacterium]|nr:hypothetical protein [Desulfatiglandales bacterium]